MSQPLEGKVAIITGAGRGLGRAAALAFAEAGAAVVVNDTGGTYRGVGIDASVAESTAKEIRDAGGRALAIEASVSEPDGAESIAATALREFGQIDALVNNAGISRQNMVWDMPVDDWDAVLAVHLRGSFLCIRAVVDPMIERRSGRIINMSSSVFAGGAVANCSYTAAKAGVIGLTNALALDLGPLGITVNAVCPAGWTRLHAKSEPWRDKYPAQQTPSMPESDWPAEHVAPMLVYLASDEATDVNGQVFSVGGKSVAWYAPMAVARAITSSEGRFEFDELATRTPAELLIDAVNPAPRQPDEGRSWPFTRPGGLPSDYESTPNP